MFLTRDLIGAASRIEYGKCGDEVLVIKDFDDQRKLVEINGQRFIVNKDFLTYETKDDTKTINRSPKSI